MWAKVTRGSQAYANEMGLYFLDYPLAEASPGRTLVELFSILFSFIFLSSALLLEARSQLK